MRAPLEILALNVSCVRRRDVFRLFAAGCVVLAGSVGAASAVAGGGSSAESAITVTDAWVRAVPPVAKNSAGYLLIRNAGSEDVLLGATIDGARVTEIHEMVRSGESMAMRPRVQVVVPASGRVELAPGGLHLMLIDLQKPLQVGAKLKGVLRFRDAGEVKVEMTILAQ